MPYVSANDFKVGVDRRRSRVAGTPGSLWTCKNAHLTRGGEVEKRYKFVEKYVLPAGTFGCLVFRGTTYVFGSIAEASLPFAVPSGVSYQRLQHPMSSAMVALLDATVFDGKIYAIAEYADDSVHHFYNRERVTAWDDGVIDVHLPTLADVATQIAQRINANADEVASAVAVGNVITITGETTGDDLEVTAEAENVEGGVNDQTAVVAVTTAAVTPVAEVLSSGYFTVNAGTPGVSTITSILVGGVEVLGATVTHTTDNATTAGLIATQVNLYNSSPEYTAVAEGTRVTIRAAAGTGATPNGFTIAGAVAGGMSLSSPIDFAGGVTAVTGVAQVVTVTLGGTAETGDRFVVTIGENQYGAGDNPANKATRIITHRSKIYALAGEIVYFCAVDDPLTWRANVNGAGFINTATREAGSLDLIGAGKYQGNIAFFSYNAVQIWTLDEDPLRNVPLDTLQNTGSVAGGSIQAYGNNDTFYLARSGLRSLRARDSSDSAFVSDVGNAIDTLLLSEMADLTEDELADAQAIIEPVDGRYWLSLGDKLYVLSSFPGAKIAAWSWYETGFAIDLMSVDSGKVYVRSGDTIYLYGGDTGREYDASAGDNYEVEVGAPFYGTTRGADDKTLTAYDAAVEGTWTVEVLVDPRDENRKVTLGEISEITFPNKAHMANGYGTHYAPLLTCATPGAAKVISFTLHYENEEPLAVL